jgi:hypothetical protein
MRPRGTGVDARSRDDREGRVISERAGDALTTRRGSRLARAASAVGLGLIVASVLLPPPVLLDGLGVSSVTAPAVWTGARLFRLGLAALGVYLVVAGRLPIWSGAARPWNPAIRRPSWAGAVLVAILALALAIRLRRLGGGLWYDEIIAHVQYMHMSLGEILTTYRSESQHVLFTLLARISLTLLGDGAASLRLPAVLFGVASVGALYLLARQVTTAGEALLSAALLSVSYHHVWFSQNARGYTALLFWTLLSSWLLLRALDEGRPGLWLGYAAAVALGMFTHVTMLFGVLAHAVVYAAVLVRPRASRAGSAPAGAVLGFGLAGLLTFQLYALVLPQFLSTIGMTAKVPEWTSPLWALQELARGLRTGFAGGVVAAGALLVTGAGLLSYRRTAPVIVILLVLPAVAVAATVWAMGHPLWPRLFFSLMGFGVLIAVRGATTMGDWVARVFRTSPPRAAFAGTALALLLVLASATTVPAAWGPKQDYAGARGFIDAHREPGDAVVTVGLATLPYRAFFHAGWEAAASAEALATIRSRASRTWVLCTIPLHLQGQHPDLMAAIRRDFTLAAAFPGTLSGGTIYVYRDRDGSPAGGAGAGTR